MNHIIHTAEIVYTLNRRFGLDYISLMLLQGITQAWVDGKEVTVSEVLDMGKGSSTMTLHTRLVKVLKDLDYVRYTECPEDRRIKLVVPGDRLADLQKYLRETNGSWHQGRDPHAKPLQKQMELDL